MRLFHTSDTHLGHQQYPRTTPEGLNQREVDVHAAFTAVVDAAIAERPDLVVHAGDLFDGVRPGNRALAVAMEGFVRLSDAGIPTVVIAGNHEHPRMRETGSPFRLFDHLEHVHMVFRGHRESLEVPTANGVARVHAVPQAASNDELRDQVEGAPVAGRDGGTPPADGERVRHGPDVLVVHGAVTSLKAFRHAEFNELSLDPAWFGRFDYAALGHHHGAQEVAPNAWYCGAPERVSMAEAGEPKGFLDVVVEKDRTPAVRFRPLPGRPYADLGEVAVAGLGAQAVGDAVRDRLENVPSGAVVRVQLRELDPGLRGVLDMRRLRALRPDLVHLDLRLAWRDDAHALDGAARVGALADEFESFVARQPVPTDRDRVLAIAWRALEDARVTAEQPPTAAGAGTAGDDAEAPA